MRHAKNAPLELYGTFRQACVCDWNDLDQLQNHKIFKHAHIYIYRLIATSHVLQIEIDEQIHMAQIIDNRTFWLRRPSSACKLFAPCKFAHQFPFEVCTYTKTKILNETKQKNPKQNKTNTNQRSHHSCMCAMFLHQRMAKGSSKEPGNKVGQPCPLSSSQIHKI